MATAKHEIDQRFMRRALRLAERGRGRVSPNPIVGAVLVRAGRVVGEGWHPALGEPHAEAMALARAGRLARGATLYVTLEPCAHVGRTPPCAQALIAAGVKRCVVGLKDPHPIVSGRGLKRLRAAGVRVDLGILGDEVEQQLAGYLQAHRHHRPRVTLKLAASLDGRIAPPGGFGRSGDERWLTGSPARREAHRLRAHSDAVVIGSGTARTDDPRLTARAVGAKRQPLRVICDTKLRLPATLHLLRHGLGTVVVCGKDAPRSRQAAIEARGARVWRVVATSRGVSPKGVLMRLLREGCYEVLLEGGAKLAASWLAAGVVDRIALFTAPRVLGVGGTAWPGTEVGAWQGRVIEQKRAGRDLYTLIEVER